MKLHATITDRGPLTRQEARVLQLLSTGLLRKQIAAVTYRSYGTVSKQVESIARKLDAHSAAEIVAKAVAARYVDITLKTWLMVLLCQCSFAQINLDMRRSPTAPRPPLTRCQTRNTTPRLQRET